MTAPQPSGPRGGLSIAKVFSITNAPLTVLPVHLNVIGNKNFTGPVATFTDGNPLHHHRRLQGDHHLA